MTKRAKKTKLLNLSAASRLIAVQEMQSEEVYDEHGHLAGHRRALITPAEARILLRERQDKES
jgi:hypothetical protein